jgi:hypothetical protein
MEMNKNLVKDKALTAVNKLKANIKGTYYHLADIPSASVKELADFIRNHPDTKVKQKKLLGITFSFYQLKTNDDYLYLETNNFRILQLDAYAKGKPFVSYRSYRDSYTLNTPIKLS